LISRKNTSNQNGIAKRVKSDGGGGNSSNLASIRAGDVPAYPNEAGPSNVSNTSGSTQFVDCKYERVPENPTIIHITVGTTKIFFPVSEVGRLLRTLTKYQEWNTPKPKK